MNGAKLWSHLPENIKSAENLHFSESLSRAGMVLLVDVITAYLMTDSDLTCYFILSILISSI